MKTPMKILTAIGVIILVVVVAFMVFRVEEPATNVDSETEKELSTNVDSDTEEELSTNVDLETEKEPSTDGNSETSLAPIASNEDLTALVDQIYEGLEIEMPMLMSQTIDVTDSETVKYITGLDNADDVEYVVASEPMMTSQAY